MKCGVCECGVCVYCVTTIFHWRHYGNELVGDTDRYHGDVPGGISSRYSIYACLIDFLLGLSDSRNG